MDLTPFDYHRQPRRLKDIPEYAVLNSTIEVSKKTIETILREDLTCPICLQTIDNTLSVTSCLHRFCATCLEKSLRMMKQTHECPSCRGRMGSRRDSKPDTNYDELIAIIHKKLDPPTIGIKRELEPDTEFDLEEFQRMHEQRIKLFRQESKLKAGSTDKYSSQTSQSSNNNSSTTAQQQDAVTVTRRDKNKDYVAFELSPMNNEVT